MEKIFFFQKRNPNTGELLNDFIDADERNGWNYLNKPRFYKYIGWSDGSFIKAIKSRNIRLGEDKRGIKKQISKKLHDELIDAYNKEVQSAVSNSDKTPPRDLTKMQFGPNSPMKLMDKNLQDKLKLFDER